MSPKKSSSDPVESSEPPHDGARARAPRVGDIVADKYRIDRIIGKGGMGLVVAAEHLQLRETVALKFLLTRSDDSAEFRGRFLREAQVSAKLRGEHVARVTDFGVPDDGPPYMVMEHLDGTDLKRLMQTHGPFGLDAALDVIVQACEGLAEAHSLGVVHRDLKPSNVFVTRRLDGTDLVKILDFGVSKMCVPDEGDEDLTAVGSVLGSPRYMSPEQLRSANDVDARADLWSLGAIFHELLAGEPVFSARSTAALCAKILGDDPIPSLSAKRPGIPARVERIILGCLEREREKRVPDVATLVSQLAIATELPFIEAAALRISAIAERRSTRGDLTTGSYPGAATARPAAPSGRMAAVEGSAPSGVAQSGIAPARATEPSTTPGPSARPSELASPRRRGPALILPIAAVCLGLGVLLLVLPPRGSGGQSSASAVVATAPPPSASASPVVTPATAASSAGPGAEASPSPSASPSDKPVAPPDQTRRDPGAGRPLPTSRSAPKKPPVPGPTTPRSNPLDDRF